MSYFDRTVRPHGSGLDLPRAGRHAESRHVRFASVVVTILLASSALRVEAQGVPVTEAAPAPAPEAQTAIPEPPPPDTPAVTEPEVARSIEEGPLPDATVVQGGMMPTPPTTILTPPSAPPARVEVTARPGQGITVDGGEMYSITFRPRIQLRDTFLVNDDVNGRVHDPNNEIAIRALRLWILGRVLNHHIRYGIQLAFGAGEFEKGNPSPIYDAFFDFTRFRDVSVKIGQYFVPFDRARTIREFALQTVDRTNVVNQMTLDRDVGVSVYSNDFLGLGGKLGYQLGVFGGEGRNRLGGDRLGFLYTARLSFRPFGSFDEDVEGDLTRTLTPKLLLGVAGAYDQRAQRVRGTTGADFVGMSPSYVWGDVDAVFKYRGFSFMGEVVLRTSSTYRHEFVPSTGASVLEYTQRALGYLVQGSYVFSKPAELWGRYEELHTPWVTDPGFMQSVHDAGRTVSGGANYYFNAHAFKVMVQAAHTFGYDGNFLRGITTLFAQIDASF